MEYGGNDQLQYLQMTHPQISFRRNMAEYTRTGLPCCSVLRHWRPAAQQVRFSLHRCLLRCSDNLYIKFLL